MEAVEATKVVRFLSAEQGKIREKNGNFEDRKLR